jgi:hypothetical protein
MAYSSVEHMGVLARPTEVRPAVVRRIAIGTASVLQRPEGAIGNRGSVTTPITTLSAQLRFLRVTWWFSVEEQCSVLQMYSRFSSALSQFACQSHAEANSRGCTCRLLDLLVRPCLRREIEGHLRRERQRANKKDKILGEHAETRFLLSGEQLEIYFSEIYFSKIYAGQSAISW